MTDRFAELLHELGKHLHLPLHVDKHSACSIQTAENLLIQLELDISQENLFIFSKIVEIPPGKFRENVLSHALKANALSDPRAGIFGYLDRSNQLILFQRYPLAILSGERLAGLIGSFLELGNAWRSATENGRLAPLKF